MENETTAVVDNPYGLRALWEQGDIVARSVLVLLALMSLFSWYIMLTKLWDQRKLQQAGQGCRKAVLDCADRSTTACSA